MPKCDTGSLAGLKDFYQWYVSEVDNIKNPNSFVIKCKDTYNRFLKFWEDSCSSKKKQHILKDMINFYTNCIEECKDHIVKYGDYEDDISDMMKLDEITLEMLKTIN